ncbi:MAG: DEAD/DEAH box helicase, partial [Synergistaceae bacterium]|nr:DEAD/DEAH box helicase [Synergistaceae bacterium]
SHVIQLGLPDDVETFIHRSGRTGRAGHEGINLVLISPPEAGRFKDMLRGTEIKTEWLNIPDIEKIRSAWRDSAEQEIFAAPIDKDFGDCVEWASDLMKRAEPKILIAKLLSVLSARNKGYSLDKELKNEQERRKRKPASRTSTPKSKIKSGSKPKGFFRRFRSVKGNPNTGQILNAMCTALKVERDEIGAIRMRDNYILVELMPLALSKLDQAKAGLMKFGLHEDEEKQKRTRR